MQEGPFESLKRYLEAEDQSGDLVQIPADTYSKLAVYSQNLRRTSTSNGDDLTARLVKKQTKILEGMANELLQLRLRKASKSDGVKNLLPEEKYVRSSLNQFKERSDRFINAITNGYPSFFGAASREEMSRQVMVRFLKNIGEIMGFDMKKYGPFKIHDLAAIPMANAEALIANGEAVLVQL